MTQSTCQLFDFYRLPPGNTVAELRRCIFIIGDPERAQKKRTTTLLSIFNNTIVTIMVAHAPLSWVAWGLLGIAQISHAWPAAWPSLWRCSSGDYRSDRGCVFIEFWCKLKEEYELHSCRSCRHYEGVQWVSVGLLECHWSRLIVIVAKFF